MIVLDIETSGVNPEKHSILSIGAIDFSRSEQVFSEECRIWEGAHIEPESLIINGFTEAQITDPSKKSEEEIVRSFLAWMEEREERTIAGQNPSFDVSFIQAAALRYHLNMPLARRSIDIHSIVYFHMIKRGQTPPLSHHHSGLNSDIIMEYVGIPAEPKPHIAFNGAIWEAEALHRLLYDKPLMSRFEQFKIPWN
jgi:DNA polymerase III epsilon subunit-like protein